MPVPVGGTMEDNGLGAVLDVVAGLCGLEGVCVGGAYGWWKADDACELETGV